MGEGGNCAIFGVGHDWAVDGLWLGLIFLGSKLLQNKKLLYRKRFSEKTIYDYVSVYILHIFLLSGI